MFEVIEAFRTLFNTLALVGYFKIVTPVTKLRYTLHYCYRILVWIAVITYNLQLLLLSIQNLHCTEQLLGTLFILLTTLNTLGKQATFNLRVKRIDNVIDVLKSSTFAPKNSSHEDIARANAISMTRLHKLYLISVTICGILFTSYPLINRSLGQEVQVPGYFPFDTNEAPIFHIAVVYMSILITLQAYGHVTMDCTIVGFYAQAKTQLQILRHDFEHFVDDFESRGKTSVRFKYYIDNKNHKQVLQKKFIGCLDHYELIVWFAKEVESIFGEAMTFQFFAMVWVICMTTYKIVGLSLDKFLSLFISFNASLLQGRLPVSFEQSSSSKRRPSNDLTLSIMSAEFISIVMYLMCMLVQLYIYCYFGTLLRVESEQVNDSIYQSGWQSLSPAFRRQLYMLMERCKRTLEPRTANVIPMSLDTYISVLRSSYALFTILDRK